MNMFHGHKLSLMVAGVVGMCGAGAVQAATLTCGTPLIISTQSKTGWSTDARQVANPALFGVIRDDFRWQGTTWFDPAAQSPAMTGKWLSFGDGPSGDPAVTIAGTAANGYWVPGRATFIYNDPITIGANVDLSTIKISGKGGADNGALLVVKPSTLPGGVANSTWLTTTPLLGGSWTAPATIPSTAVNGFYYGNNTIGLAVNSEDTTDVYPAGVVADLEITADCLTPVAAQPTAPLICPVGNTQGQTVRIGPFTTNARDWRWTWRTNTAGTALEANTNPAQPLFDDFIWRGYFRPATLTGADATSARWISPGTVNPISTDVPGVPYPVASGMNKAGYNSSVFTMNQPITVGNNVDLASIKLTGRFGFDDTGDSVFVQPAGQPGAIAAGFPLPDGYGAFTTVTTSPIPGFARGQNTVGLTLSGGQARNDCGGGTCAMAAIADFYVEATCTGEAPIALVATSTPVPALGTWGLALLAGLLGLMGMHRRQRT